MSGWSEWKIARELAVNVFDRRSLVMLPNCKWTGYECDLLVVTADLRVIDVEVKISRADLKADAKKDKWWEPATWRNGRVKQPLLWPPKAWKHYYALPADIWKPELLDAISPASGVLLLSHSDDGRSVFARCERRAKPDLAATRISPEAAIDIARLASLRYWDLAVASEINRDKGYA